MEVNSINVLNHRFIYDIDNIRIIDSYTVTDEVSMKYMISDFIKKTNYNSKRCMDSYINEWKVHNLFYNKLHIFKTNTKNCDFEQNIKWYVNLFYNIVSKFC